MIWYNDMIYNMQYYLPILCEGQAWGQAVGPSQKACLFQCLSPWLFSTRPCKHRFVNYSTVFSPCGPFLLKPLVSKTTGITVQLNKAIGQNPIYFTRQPSCVCCSWEAPIFFCRSEDLSALQSAACKILEKVSPIGRRVMGNLADFACLSIVYPVYGAQVCPHSALASLHGSSFSGTVVEQWPNLSSHQPFCCQMKILQQNVAMVERDLAGNTGMLEIFKCIAFLWIHQQPGVWVSCKQFMWKSWW